MTSVTTTPPTPVVAFITDNGHGMGHITRLYAIARRARGRFTPVFITMSEGYPVLAADGIPREYLPSKDKLGVAQFEWVDAMAPWILDGLAATAAAAVVVDHVAAPKLAAPLQPVIGDTTLVWSRRGMWKPGRNLGNANEGPGVFDSIVEPLDVTSPLDRGASASHRARVTAVPPITLVHPSEYLDRDEARDALGLERDSLAILMQVTGPDAERIEGMIGRVAGILQDRGSTAPIQLFAPIHVLHDDNLEPSRPVAEGVTTVRRRVYPMARYLQAFDGVISTTGYNSFHEVLQSGVPGLFVPRDSDTLDDQPARSRVPELIGAGLHAERLGDPDVPDKLTRLLDPVLAAGSRAASRTLFKRDGAAAFADHLVALLDRRPDDPQPPGSLRPGRPVLSAFLPGLSLVSALHVDDATLEELCRVLEDRVPSERRHTVFVLVNGGDGRSLRRVGVAQVRVMGPDEWASLDTVQDYEAYLARRAEVLDACLGPVRAVATTSPDWIDELATWEWD
ncbi:hypothetical protein [Salsipaludibacter albus]|uniref:hypothetical protein n=1 Tax=Salsipaludibacter albus TaxID=2849650 RepID=UPI001EE45E27|nr:hypothetical protein [Salsipaludibacter albus]MBY5161218.1 hypothetical protein [Salsipaludibacter albus]